MWDMTHSNDWYPCSETSVCSCALHLHTRTLILCETRLIHLCETWLVHMCVIWSIHMSSMRAQSQQCAAVHFTQHFTYTHAHQFYVRHDSFICARHDSFTCVWYGSFIWVLCVLWDINVQQCSSSTHTRTRSIWDPTHWFVRDMTHSYVCDIVHSYDRYPCSLTSVCSCALHVHTRTLILCETRLIHTCAM